jgi:hypothetical protein
MLWVEVSQSLDEVNLLQSQLHGIQVLRVARNVGGPELKEEESA